MKITGIIAEYNPFHEGHGYHIGKSREMTDADLIIAVMSGSYTQRGIPAFFDKFSRAEEAVKNGADIVLELPLTASLSSAEYFARAGVSILNAAGCDTLSFGSESGNIEKLSLAAKLLGDESPEMSEAIKKGLSEGLSYPAAVSAALDKADSSLSELALLPNNTLGIEYLKAINALNCEMKAVTVKRLGSYHEGEQGFTLNTCLTPENESFPSSSYLRKTFKNDRDTRYMENDDFTGILSGKIHSLVNTLSHPGRKFDFSSFADVSPDFSDRINNEILMPYRFDSLAQRLKTKNITYARVCRSLWHIILDIKNEDLLSIKEASSPEYIRVLAFNENGGKYIKEMKEAGEKDPSRPKMIVKPARDMRLLSNRAQVSFIKELNAAKLYRQAYYEKYGIYLPDDYSYSVKPVKN